MARQQSRHLSRTNLFLVRVWNEDAADDPFNSEWHGRVQRVVDGEAHQFDNWQDLTELLLQMLSRAGTGMANGLASGPAVLTPERLDEPE